MTQDNQDLLKLCVQMQQQMQQNQRWGMVKDCVLTALTVLPTLYMLWQNHKKNRANSKVRLIRVEATRAKLDADAKAKRAKLDIEEAAIKQEAAHEAELKKMETGHQPAENQPDFLSGLKQKGTNLLKDKVGNLSKKVKIDQLTSLIDKDKKEKD